IPHTTSPGPTRCCCPHATGTMKMSGTARRPSVRMRIGRDMGASAKLDVPAWFDSVTVGRLYMMSTSMSYGNQARALGVAVLLAVGFGASVSRAQTLPPGLTEYAVLGVAGVRIGRDSRVLSGAVGSVDGTVRLGPKARVSSVVAAPTVRLGLAAHTGPL